jgi:hypothetical protein
MREELIPSHEEIMAEIRRMSEQEALFQKMANGFDLDEALDDALLEEYMLWCEERAEMFEIEHGFDTPAVSRDGQCCPGKPGDICTDDPDLDGDMDDFECRQRSYDQW